MATITPTIARTAEDADRLLRAIQSSEQLPTKTWPEKLVKHTEAAIQKRFAEAQAAYSDHIELLDPRDLAELNHIEEKVVSEYKQGDSGKVNTPNKDSLMDIQKIENLADHQPDAALAELEKLFLNSEETGQQMEQADDHVHQKQWGKTLASYYVEAQLLQSSLVKQYASMSPDEQLQVKKLAFQEKNLSQARFTPEEVREMLRRFVLLDRLVDPSNELEKAQKRANEAYNAPQDAEALMELRDGMRRTAQLSAEDQQKYKQRMRMLGHVPDEEAKTSEVDFTKIEKYMQQQFTKALIQRKARSVRADQGFNYRDEFGMVTQPGEQNPFEELTDQHQIARLLERHGAKRSNFIGRIASLTNRMRIHLRRGIETADRLPRPLNPEVRAIGEWTTSQDYARAAVRSMKERVR